ncbi:hypothetical protein L2096_13455 [Acinetobacter sp. ACZLY 512]|uniref:hypothetical protein n=1 Tax=Acinetobacter sp. ACZLY 512 TaxID=2911206 RepID=UPI00202759AA|nr:hypothetical protein [Acinetobacter sp. ACZLY 512]MCL9677223.1 hypothetical protein [Acinetobacter sp. ACZLY 512]
MNLINLNNDIPFFQTNKKSTIFKDFFTVKTCTKLKFLETEKLFYGYSCGELSETLLQKSVSELKERLYGYINLLDNKNFLAYDIVNHEPKFKENVKFFFGLTDNSYIYNDSTGLAYHPTNFELALNHGKNELNERYILGKLWLNKVKVDKIISTPISEKIRLKQYLINEYKFCVTLCIFEDFISLGCSVDTLIETAKIKSKAEAFMVADEFYSDRLVINKSKHKEALRKCFDLEFIKYIENKFDNALSNIAYDKECLTEIYYINLKVEKGFLVRVFSPDFIHYSHLKDENSLIVPLI